MAVWVADRIAPLDIRWFEEPVSPDDHAGYRKLRTRTAIPLAAGENEVTRYPFVSLLADGALDVLQPDVAVVGGLTEMRRIAVLAHAQHRLCVPRVWHSSLIVAASLQLAAASSNCPIFEIPMSRNALIWGLTTPEIWVENGEVVVPDGPGLGVELVPVDAAEDFFTALAGVTEPEQKRRIVGEKFIRIFEREAKSLGKPRFLVQGTIYPDVVESAEPERNKAAAALSRPSA